MSRFYRPVLNDSVDVKLQSAFNDGQWSTVARLAAQRYKMRKDPYYEVRLPHPSAPESPTLMIVVDHTRVRRVSVGLGGREGCRGIRR